MYTGNFERRKARLLRAYAIAYAQWRAMPHAEDAAPHIARTNAINFAYRRLITGLITERSQP